jgi:hypothetical protein
VGQGALRIVTFRGTAEQSRHAVESHGWYSGQGMCDAFLARREVDGEVEHVLVSVWRSREQMEAAVRDNPVPYPAGTRIVDVLELVVRRRFVRSQAPWLLRLLHGRIPIDEQGAHLESIERDAATLANVGGCSFLAVGLRPEGVVRAVTLWTETASMRGIRTGPVSRPLTPWAEGEALHYELVQSFMGEG